MRRFDDPVLSLDVSPTCTGLGVAGLEGHLRLSASGPDSARGHASMQGSP